MKPLLFCTFAVLCVVQVSGWGHAGHATIAQLAHNMLTPQALEMVNGQLGPGQTMPSISSWPDQYCHTEEGRWSSCLHFINVQQKEHLYLYAHDCVAVDDVSNCCAAAAILNFTQQVSDIYESQQDGGALQLIHKFLNTKSQQSQQPDAQHPQQPQQPDAPAPPLIGEPTPLSYLIHFVGDIHQPLHCGFDCDYGGNSLEVIFFGERDNFHNIWDDGMIDKYSNGNWTWFAEELQAYIDSHPELYTVISKVMNNTLWAEESYNEYTRHKVYDFTEEGLHHNSGDKMVYPFDDCPHYGVVELPSTYYKRNIEVVKKRLTAGGIRLAAILNAVAEMQASSVQGWEGLLEEQ